MSSVFTYRTHLVPIRQWRIIFSMVILETSIFTRCIRELIADDDYAELQLALVQNPALGSVIRGSGGIRKLRWSAAGRGKRGGIRIIYYWYVADEQIFMLYAYVKNQQADLSPDQLRVLRTIVEEEFGSGQKGV